MAERIEREDRKWNKVWDRNGGLGSLQTIKRKLRKTGRKTCHESSREMKSDNTILTWFLSLSKPPFHSPLIKHVHSRVNVQKKKSSSTCLQTLKRKPFQSHQSLENQAAYKKKGKHQLYRNIEHYIKNIAKILTFIEKLLDLRTKSI